MYLLKMLNIQNRRLKIALISHLFPTELYPFHGKFIKDQLLLLNGDDEITADLYVPTPHSIPFTKRHRKNTSKLLSDEVKAARVPYLSFPKKRFPEIIARSLSNALEKQLKQRNYDIIHVHWLYPDGLSIPRLKQLGFKVVLTIHGSDWYKNLNDQLLMDICKNIFHLVDHVFFVGDQLREDVISVFPIIKEKSSVVYNFVDEDIYTLPSKEKKEAALKSLGWNPKKKHFLTVASSNPEKGVDLLMDAVEVISHTYSDIEFHVVGTSKEHFPASSSIVSFHSPVSPQELVHYYHASDAYISPSRKEGFGLAMIEAAATGLPVVATSTGIAPYYIHEKTGILCDEISSENIADAAIAMTEEINLYRPDEIRTKCLIQFGKEVILKMLKKQYRLLRN